MKRFALTLLFVGGAALAGPASGQCVSIDTATVSTPYNPFNASTQINQVLTLNIRRIRTLLEYPGDANLVFVRRPGSPADLDIIAVQDDGGSGGTSVLYPPPGPALSILDNNSGEIDLKYGSALQPDLRTAQVRVTAPVSTDLPAGNVDAVFDIKYLCEDRLLPLNTTSGTIPSGLTIRLVVLSALQASLVGGALDFGEIGALSTSQISTAPDTVKVRSSFARVASSGPYSVNAKSQNGWKLTKDGAPTANNNERIGYRFSLAGRNAESGTDYVTKVCARAGVAGEYLPVTVTLLEGGFGKMTSPLYQDIVDVTFTPLGATDAPNAQSCK